MIQKNLVKVSQQQQNFIRRQFHSNERFQKRQEPTTIQTTGIDGLYIPRRWRNQIYQNYCIVLFFHLKIFISMDRFMYNILYCHNLSPICHERYDQDIY